MKPYSILLVRMGNICRNPTAHGVFQHKIRAARRSHRVRVDSADAHNFHPGNLPNQRSQEDARRRGYDHSELRARQISADDYDRHNLILVMDWDNLALVEDACEGLIKQVTRNGSS